MTTQDRVQFARCCALEARREAERIELRDMAIADGYSMSHANRIARDSHPYATLKRWRENLRRSGLGVTREDAYRLRRG